MIAARPHVYDLTAVARRVLAAPPTLSVSDWADQYRVLSREASAEAGSWRTDRTPYLREIMDTMGAVDAPRRGVFVKSAQVGGTECINNLLGYLMAEDPCPILCIQPTVEMAKTWSKERLDPMLRDTPRLQGLVQSGKGRRVSDDTLQRKIFPGGYVAVTGSNSPATLRSRPVRKVLADELDAWPDSAGDEGDPLELAERRTTTFWNGGVFAVSTPTLEGFSRIWSLWEESDQRHFEVPCPHCGEYQPLRWRDDRGEYLLVCDRDAAGELLPETAQYRCVHCACLIDEREKPQMLAAGRWRAHQPGRPTAGWWIWAGYSPWMRWSEIVAQFQKAKRSEESLQVFVNTILGLPFAPSAESVDPSGLMQRAEPVDPLPPAVGLLTIGVDVQIDRVEAVLLGWGEREEAWVLEHRPFWGDPQTIAPWAELDAWAWEARDGLVPRAMAVDTGYLPRSVWQYVDRAGGARGRLVIGTKGEGGRGRPLLTRPGVSKRKGTRSPWLVGTDTAKDLLAHRLRTAAPGPQSVHFADTLDRTFYDQLTAEQVQTVYVAGRPTRRWVLKPHRRNEALDGVLLAIVAYDALGPGAPRHIAEVIARRGGAVPAVAAADTGPTPGEVVAPPALVPRPTRPRVQKGRTSWVTRF